MPRLLNHPPLHGSWIDAPHRAMRVDRFPLDSGEAIEDFLLSYVVHGTLNAARDNAILVLTAIGASHHRLDFLIGPGRALDPAEHCIICVDAIGNGLASSPSNSARQPGTHFPAFTIRDMVRSQHRLVRDVFGVDRLALVIGASMGGMQALQWAVTFPERVERLAALTPMAKTHPWSVAANAAARAALMADPDWACPGHVCSGWEAWVPLMQMLIGRTPDSLRHDFADAAAIEQGMARQRRDFHDYPGRAVDWIWQSRAYDAHDIGAADGYAGDTGRALRSIGCPLLVSSSRLDLYNPSICAREIAAAVPGATYLEIDSIRGHQMANGMHSTEAETLNRRIAEFIRRQARIAT